MRIDFDDDADVLYLRFEAERIAYSRESDDDGELIINLNAAGAVVGVQLLGALILGPEGWQAHPERPRLPAPLREALDGWYRALPPKA